METDFVSVNLFISCMFSKGHIMDHLELVYGVEAAAKLNVVATVGRFYSGEYFIHYVINCFFYHLIQSTFV